MKNHFFDNGNWLTISNSTIKDKTLQNFYGSNPKYRALVINEEADLRYAIILDFLKKSIFEKASKKDSIDIQLTTEETESIKTVFEREINHILSIRKTPKTGYNTTIFGKKIKLDTRNQTKTDSNLLAFNEIYLIAKECLDENKPMYLSID